jgi:hypothetical protein
VLEGVVSAELDEPAAARLQEMEAKYADFIARVRTRPA